jgi:hypothetical protein
MSDEGERNKWLYLVLAAAILIVWWLVVIGVMKLVKAILQCL